MRHAICDVPVSAAKVALEITVSVGCAALSPEEKEAAPLLARADARLYDAKRGGRNRVVFAPTRVSEPEDP